MQMTGDVVPTFAARPARPGWRTVLTRLAVIGYLVLQGVRLGLAFHHVPLPQLLGGVLLVFVIVAVLSARTIVRKGAVTSAVAVRYLVRLGLSMLVLMSTGILIGRAIPAGSVGRMTQAGAKAIPGAPGYTTFYGQHGLPIALGHPWGEPCTPVRFILEHDVGADVRVQVKVVVAEARRAGLNVTLQDAQGMWIDNSVYYPKGVTKADVANVYIGADRRSSVRLANGYLSQVAEAHDSATDGTEEHLTAMTGVLRLRVVGGNAWLERVSIRDIVKYSQGISGVPPASSGMDTGTSLDAFSPTDIAAMQLMSGCGTQALATVTNPYFKPAGNP